MITTNAKSKIDGAQLSHIELVISSSGDISMRVKANLVSSHGEIFGVTERVGGWSENVIKAVGQLTDSLEMFIISKTFGVEEENHGSIDDSSRPEGIIKFGLEDI